MLGASLLGCCCDPGSLVCTCDCQTSAYVVSTDPMFGSVFYAANGVSVSLPFPQPIVAEYDPVLSGPLCVNSRWRGSIGSVGSFNHPAVGPVQICLDARVDCGGNSFPPPIGARWELTYDYRIRPLGLNTPCYEGGLFNWLRISTFNVVPFDGICPLLGGYTIGFADTSGDPFADWSGVTITENLYIT